MYGRGFVFEDLRHGRGSGAQAAKLQHLSRRFAADDADPNFVSDAASQERRKRIARFWTEHGRAPPHVEDEATELGAQPQDVVVQEGDHLLGVLGALLGAQVGPRPDLTDGEPISFRDEVVIALLQPHGLSKALLSTGGKRHYLAASSQSSTRGPLSFLPSSLALAAGSAGKLVALRSAASTLHLSSKVWATSAATAPP